MARANEKLKLINYENTIKKSNELSMAKLNRGLTLNQMQLLAYAIFSTQQDGKTDFHKADFEKKFGIEKYQTVHARQDSKALLDLKFSIEDIEHDYFEYYNVFQSIKYDKGLFHFKWTEDMIPHILELKQKHITTDLTITSQFKSGFSWILYEYLKAHYGYWHKELSKDALMKLFNVENKKTYQENTGRFKATVLDMAISEVKEYTELEVWYVEKKKGRAIVGFDIHWSTGVKETAATSAQIKELSSLIESVVDGMFTYVNVSNDADREDAIKLIGKVRDFIQHIQEPICITKQYADNLILLTKSHFNQLELILERDIKAKKNPKPKFYNWLDERE